MCSLVYVCVCVLVWGGNWFFNSKYTLLVGCEVGNNITLKHVCVSGWGNWFFISKCTLLVDCEVRNNITLKHVCVRVSGRGNWFFISKCTLLVGCEVGNNITCKHVCVCVRACEWKGELVLHFKVHPLGWL